MRTTPKYQAKLVFFDTDKRIVIDSNEINKYRTKDRLKLPEYITRFDSQHEFKVYLELCRMYGVERIVRQYSVTIIPPGKCYPKGKTWKVDFAVLVAGTVTEVEYFVEAKGAVLSEFVNILVLLEQQKPKAFESLYVVFPRSIPTENKVINALSKQYYAPYFCTLEELKQSIRLPLPL